MVGEKEGQTTPTENVSVNNKVANSVKLQKGQTGLRLRTGHMTWAGPVSTVSAVWRSKPGPPCPGREWQVSQSNSEHGLPSLIVGDDGKEGERAEGKNYPRMEKT